PGAPAPAPAAAPVAQAQAQQPIHADPVLASKTVEVPRGRHTPAWVVPTLLVVAVAAAGVFFNADRIVRRQRQ
ncbi:hypothetical protein ACFTVM_29400, partial [Nocardia sp. NPDC057030]